MRLEDAMRQMSGEPELAREVRGEALSVPRSVEASTAIHTIERLGIRRQLPNRRMRTRMSWWCGRGVAGRTRYPLSRSAFTPYNVFDFYFPTVRASVRH